MVDVAASIACIVTVAAWCFTQRESSFQEQWSCEVTPNELSGTSPTGRTPTASGQDILRSRPEMDVDLTRLTWRTKRLHVAFSRRSESRAGSANRQEHQDR